MTEATQTTDQKRSLAGTATALARRYVGGRRRLILVALAIVATAAVFSWSWLVAAGIAPLLLAVAPCAAMCALGACMNKMGGKSCSAGSRAEQPVNRLQKDDKN